MLRALPLRRFLANLSIRNFASSSTPTTDVKYDDYHQSIRSTTHLDEVWKLVSDHRRDMNDTHVIATLRVLKKYLVSNESSGVSKNREQLQNYLLSNIHFEHLCNHTLRLLRTMSPGLITQLLSHLKYLSVPVETLIFQALLTSIKKRLNEFSITDIVTIDLVLSVLVKEGKDDKLIEAIRSALPVLVEIKTQFNEVPFEDVNAVVSILRFSSLHNVKISVINRLMEEIYSQHSKLDGYHCFYTFCSIAKTSNCNEVEYDTRLASDLASVCLTKMATCNYERFEADLRHIFEKVYQIKYPGYSSEFFNKAAEYYKNVFSQLSFDKMETVLRKFNGYNHVDFELVKSYEMQIKSQPQMFVSRGTPLTTLYNFASFSQYEPVNGWPFIFDIVSRQFAPFRKSMTTSQLLKLTCLYSYLKHFPDPVVEELYYRLSTFQNERYDHRVSIRRRTDWKYLLDISIALGQLEDSPTDALSKLKASLPPYLIRGIKLLDEEYKTKEPSGLQKVLGQVVGGFNLFQPFVWTEYGLCIPNLVTFDEKKVAVDLSPSGETDNEPRLLSSLTRPSKSLSISFMPLTNADVTEQDIFRSRCDLHIKSIKQLGIIVVPLNLEQFASFEGEKQISILKTVISKALDGSFSEP